MKHFQFIILLFISVSSFGQDELGYLTSSGWSIDYNNDSTIDKTYPAGYAGSIATFFSDYNGDGYIDLCKVNSDGTYLIWNWCLGDANGNFNINNPISIIFGLAATDQCLIGDFNGDKKTDIAVVRPAGNSLTWYIDYSPCDQVPDISGETFGLLGDIALSGNFNADQVDDICVYRPSTGQWFMSLSNLAGYPVFTGPYSINGLIFGTSTDIPLVGDFNGDGYDDTGFYRPAENKIYINLFSQDKPKMEGFGDLEMKGSNDQIISCPVNNILSFAVNDFNYSRPQTLPLASISDLGKKVQLRHGWTCIFDNSLNVDKWIQALQDVGINTLEYHPWMRAHDEIAPQGDTWNTYVGDDRLWTSKAKMYEKIEKFRAIGGRNVCYSAIYASTPAFARSDSAWVMRDINTGKLIDYGANYLYLMAINENVNKNYTINGKTFRNYNDYLKDQANMAQNEFNWDGWRWDWYGLPSLYNCDGLSGMGDISYEVSVLTDTLNTNVKKIRSDVTTTTLQLPYADDNIPFDMTATVADHQFLEIWPDPWATGEGYSDLYNMLYKTKSRYPDKPVFANFYPPSAMNLTTSWPKTNIWYHFATCLPAGGYPAAQIVDGVAGFTDPVPFHAVNYSTEVLTEISKWNRFVEAYGGYFYYSNPVYLFRDIRESDVKASASSSGIIIKPKERIDKRTREIDALIINLTDYGQDTANLKWTRVNTTPLQSAVDVKFKLPAGLTPDKVYFVTPDGKQEMTLSTSGDYYQVSTINLSLFGTVVVTTNRNKEMPAVPADYARTFPSIPFKYDAEGLTLNKNADTIVVLDEQTPLQIDNYYNNVLSHWEVSNNAYSGDTSIMVYPQKLYVTSNNKDAIRVPVNTYKNLQIAIKGNNATAAWFGFRLLKPSLTTSIWEEENIYYRIGSEQSDTPYITITENAPANNWTLYTRNVYEDIINHPDFGIEWGDAIIIAILLGTVEGDSVQYDSIKFTKE